MKSTRVFYWVAQLGGWFFYAMLVVLSTFVDNPSNVNVQLFIDLTTFIGLAIFFTHIMRQFFFKWHWLEMKLSPLLPRILLASLSCSLLIVLSKEGLSFNSEERIFSHFNFLKLFSDVLSVSVLLLFWNAIYFTFHFFSKSRKQELHNLELLVSRNEIEMKNLRTQLNPHFLFNSLNSIRALIELEPFKAKEAVTALSNLLRKTLQFGKMNLVSIAEELELVANYLDLEKIRFEERLQVYWNTDDNLNSFLIPPFSLQMLVENAIKHGISALIEGGEITINIQQNNSTLEIIVKNSGKLKTETDSGIGIENTRRRLDLQFKGKASFSIYQEEDQVVSCIFIQL